jgi:hypothetical protein
MPNNLTRNRDELVNAIADLAIAARAGELVRAYQREWSWIDKQNFIDAVDADEFNEAFHGIEREFDKLAETLGLGGGTLPPPWESGEITLTTANPAVLLTHGLGTQDLLVTLQFQLAAQEREALVAELNLPNLDPSREWWANIETGGRGLGVAYILPDPDHILLRAAGGIGSQQGERTVRAMVWKW